MPSRGQTVGATRARRRRVALYIAGALALAALLTYIFVFGRHGYLRRRELERENARLAAELAEVQRENAALKRELKELDDPAAVEKIAREELGLVKDGEVVYRFVTPPGSGAATAAATKPSP